MRLIDKWQKAAAALLGDAQIDVTDLSGDLELDLFLQDVVYQLGDELPSCSAIQ